MGCGGARRRPDALSALGRHGALRPAALLPCPRPYPPAASPVAAAALRAHGRRAGRRRLCPAPGCRPAAHRQHPPLFGNSPLGQPLYRPPQHRLCTGRGAAPCAASHRHPPGGGHPAGRGAHCRYPYRHRCRKRRQSPPAFRRGGAYRPCTVRLPRRRHLPLGGAFAAAPPNRPLPALSRGGPVLRPRHRHAHRRNRRPPRPAAHRPLRRRGQPPAGRFGPAPLHPAGGLRPSGGCPPVEPSPPCRPFGALLSYHDDPCRVFRQRAARRMDGRTFPRGAAAGPPRGWPHRSGLCRHRPAAPRSRRRVGPRFSALLRRHPGDIAPCPPPYPPVAGRPAQPPIPLPPPGALPPESQWSPAGSPGCRVRCCPVPPRGNGRSLPFSPFFCWRRCCCVPAGPACG